MQIKRPMKRKTYISTLGSLLALALLSACGGSSSATGQTTPTTGCATLPSFTSATAPSGGASFGDVPFPQGAVAAMAKQTASGTGLYTVTEMDICAPATTIAAVTQLYTAQMNTKGWTPSIYFPNDGGLADVCPSSQKCWGKDPTPRFAVLDHLTDAENGLVTYSLALAAPPTPPTCDASFADGFLFYLDEQQTVPLPPLTRQGVGDVAGSLQGYGMCSAGNGDSISAFFAKELPKLGWQQDPTFVSTDACPFGSGASPVWVKGGEAVQVQTFTTDPTWNWRMEFCPKQ